MTNTKLPLSICILILAIVYAFLFFSLTFHRPLIVGFLGYRWVHIYERYSWFVMYIFFVILAGFAGPHMQNLPIQSGKTEMANWMSFMATCLGFAVTWSPFSADYSVYMKEDTKTWRMFNWSFFSLISSQSLVMWLGVALATTIPRDKGFLDAFNAAGVGGLMDQSFKGHGSGAYGFGKFVQFILILSTIAVNIPNSYSLGLSMQNSGMWALKVPRFVWTTIGFVVFTVISIAGRNHFATILQNFMNCLAYWL
jgi:purine-cytosine permease-like protein